LFTDKMIMSLGKYQQSIGSFMARRRSRVVGEQYKRIGGSPIRKWTEVQGEAMCKILDEIAPQSAPHKSYIMFRYADPLTEDTLQEMKRDGVKRAVAFSQYPMYSCTTTGTFLNLSAIRSFFYKTWN